MSGSSEDEIDKEIAEEEANMQLMKDENFDEKEFEQFQQGELDLPEESDYDQSESDVVESDSDLDEYYRELGIEPTDMKEQKEEKTEEQMYKVTKKKIKKDDKIKKV